MIARDSYLKQLIDSMNDGTVKIITGIRRSGKSFLLNDLFRAYLMSQGVASDHIIQVSLDLDEFEELQNPRKLSSHIKDRLGTDSRYYVFIDEIQLCRRVLKDGVDSSEVNDEADSNLWLTFYDVLNSLAARRNVDVYVTGSNSKMLSDDIATNFRGRSTEIRVHPLSFAELFAFRGGDKYDLWNEYMTYGGMPQVVLASDERTKMKILESLFSRVYLKDVVERHKIPDGDVLDEIVNVVCSSVGSLTNPKKLSDTIRSAQGTGPSVPTVRKYLEYLRRAYLFRRAERFDVRGRKYFDYPCKYYAEDAGLRNVRLGFREQEETHLMENIIHNELVGRGYAVDVGVVESRTMENGKRISCPLEIDFVVNTGKRKVYLQSAYGMDDPRQREREKKPLMNTGDSFSKIIVTNGNQKLWTDDDGIHHIGILQFMLDSTLLDRI